MHSLRILLLFVASALATDTKNYDKQPMDYFDDDFPLNLKVGPDSTFSFNFKQTRRNKTPQIEMREENVGRYFHTRPQTTTTSSIFSMKVEKESQHVYPKIITANKYHHQQGHSNEPQASSVPPSPKFAFARPHNSQNLREKSVPTRNNPAVQQNDHKSNSNSNFSPQAPSAPTPASHSVHAEPPKSQSTPSSYIASSHPKGIEGIQFAPSASYVSDSITNNVPRQPPSLPSRGNRKFSWDDIMNARPVVNNQQPQTSSTPEFIHNKPPPPVPTLSPWYDNFGK